MAGPAPLPDIGPPQRGRFEARDLSPRGRRSQALPAVSGAGIPLTMAASGDAELLSLSGERRELLCSVIGLSVKFGLAAVAAISLFRLAGAYQQRMERQGEITAVLELQSTRLAKARERFDQLFVTEGEQRLIREQSQWIAPNRMRVVWQNSAAEPVVQTASVPGSAAHPTETTRRP